MVNLRIGRGLFSIKERAGGRYFIIKTIDEWFALYDRLASEVRGEQGALF